MNKQTKNKRFIFAIDADTDKSLKMLADKYSCSQAQVVRLLLKAAVQEAAGKNDKQNDKK